MNNKILILQLLALTLTATSLFSRNLPRIIEPEIEELQPRQKPKQQ